MLATEGSRKEYRRRSRAASAASGGTVEPMRRAHHVGADGAVFGGS